MKTEPLSVVTYRGGAAQAWHRLDGKGTSSGSPVVSRSLKIRTGYKAAWSEPKTPLLLKFRSSHRDRVTPQSSPGSHLTEAAFGSKLRGN